MQPPHDNAHQRRVAIITGSRAEFGLLKPVMHAVQSHPDLNLLVIAAGSHLIPPALTFRDVKADFDVADSIPMQRTGRPTRQDDAQALGKGIARFTRSFSLLEPDWVVVLGDRIEAFAAAAAASVGGWTLAHIHGGDRAEGIADEAMRHAITKLAHLHLPATPQSADRIRRMGEPEAHIHTVGSPAIDNLAGIDPLGDKHFDNLGQPDTLLLMHPVGATDEQEEHTLTETLAALDGRRVLALMPNHDPGRQGITAALTSSGVNTVQHLPRDQFVSLLKRIAPQGVLVGNSSAGLIECAALGVRALNIGPRQNGRERADNVTDCPTCTAKAIRDALARALASALTFAHPFGDGHAGKRIAQTLAQTDPHDAALLRKHCTF
jgi:UDP-hydrolysing UDP-N-acetyl-D-glucosamine 2-epimerase